MTQSTASPDIEDLLGALADRRKYLLGTAQGLTDDQARHRATASELTVGGLVKHASGTEQGWVKFVELGSSAFDDDWTTPDGAERAMARRRLGFTLTEDETLAEVVRHYHSVAHRTEEVFRACPNLDSPISLPAAPWTVPDSTRTARQVLLHLVGETAQHAGHADILRETIDGQRTFG